MIFKLTMCIRLQAPVRTERLITPGEDDGLVVGYYRSFLVAAHDERTAVATATQMIEDGHVTECTASKFKLEDLATELRARAVHGAPCILWSSGRVFFADDG